MEDAVIAARQRLSRAAHDYLYAVYLLDTMKMPDPHGLAEANVRDRIERMRSALDELNQIERGLVFNG